MKSKYLFVIFAFLLVVCLGTSTLAQPAAYLQAQDKKQPQPSEAEAKEANAINSLPDAAAKLAAAESFFKKYPKTTLRMQLAEHLVDQIAAIADAAQRLALAENFQKVFTGDSERDAIQPVIIYSYIQAKRIDEAFSLAATVLAKQPENVGVLAQVVFAGTEEAKRQNPKYAPQSLPYGLKVIEVIEANRKPANLEVAAWEAQKAMLPRLYQSVGVLFLVTGKAAEAKTRIEKAVTLNPSDPINYVLLASIVNDEYQQVALSHKSMLEGKPKEETLKKAMELMDKLIDLYAHAVGTSEGKPEYKQLHDQILQDLTPYYKYRHNNSTEGLQQLIDKYKTPAKP